MCDLLLMTLVFFPVALVVASVKAFIGGKEKFGTTIKDYFILSFFMGFTALACVGLPLFVLCFVLLMFTSKLISNPELGAGMTLIEWIAAGCFYLPWTVSQVAACYGAAGGKIKGWT